MPPTSHGNPCFRPSASGGRGLTQGQLFARDGSLVATVTQEGMIRTAQ